MIFPLEVVPGVMDVGPPTVDDVEDRLGPLRMFRSSGRRCSGKHGTPRLGAAAVGRSGARPRR